LDPGSEIQDPGWGKIRIRDPGHTSWIRNTDFKYSKYCPIMLIFYLKAPKFTKYLPPQKFEGQLIGWVVILS